MGHVSTGHNHNHDHNHTNQTILYDRAFLIAIVANSLFVILQIVFSYLTHSTSLLADAFHNLGDVLGLSIAWIATRLIKHKPTKKTTYGLKKTSILAALINGILLVFTCGIITTEAIYRLFSPVAIHALPVIIIASIGIFVNLTTALLFLRGSADLNIRSAYLHLLYDALISIGVVISATLIYSTGWIWIDPLVSLLIAGIILKGTWVLFSDSFRLIIDGVPRSISYLAVTNFLLKQPGVKGVHDLHIWAISTQENALSVHLYMPEKILSDELRAVLVKQLANLFNIQHVTIQVERTQVDCHVLCHDFEG